MPFTYHGNPDESPVAAIRFMVGDTVCRGFLLHDAEIAYMLALNDNDLNTTALACIEAMIVRCAHLVDERVGQVSISLSQRITGLQSLRDALVKQRDAANAPVPIPRAGGIYRSDKARSRRNPDVVQPRFAKESRRESLAGPGDDVGDPLLGLRWH